jgi:GNAT superfamily N-acetyltransferase
MWVAPEARGQGVGRRLLERLEGWMRESGGRTSHLSVTTEAAPAQYLYESAGYAPDGRVEESRHTPGLLHISLRKQLAA